MRELEQHTIFIREHIMLPEGIALAGEIICEGSSCSRVMPRGWIKQFEAGVEF